MDITQIINILPKLRTDVEIEDSEDDLLRVRLRTECSNEQQIKSWITDFERLTKTSYSIQKTPKCAGRVVAFKQLLYCHHNTRSKEVLYNNNRTKNTNCPSRMTITLYAIKKRFQGKNRELYDLRKELPCEILLVLTHNHNTESADALKYLKVRSDVTEKLITLFHNGHSPKTALAALKMDIHLTNDNPELILADRSQCPDYMYCYHLYIKQFKMKYGPLYLNATDKGLVKKSCMSKDNTKKVELQQELPEQSRERGQTAIKELSQIFENFLEDYPTREAANALEKMVNNAKKIRSPAAYLSSFSNFAIKYRRIIGRARIPGQPTVVRRRKTAITGKSSHGENSNAYRVKRMAYGRTVQLKCENRNTLDFTEDESLYAGK